MHSPRKRFGQHFLHDPKVIQRIIHAVAPRPEDELLEIGPGTGVLTEPLLGATGRLTAIEVDRDLAGHLEHRFAASGLHLLRGDILDFDFMRSPCERPWRVVGNLPYNLSTPLIFRLLAAGSALEDIHIMLQREVAERMAAGPHQRQYGRLSVMVGLSAVVEILFHVGPGAFRPPPKVESSVVRLRPRPQPSAPIPSLAQFSATVRIAFAQRRKTLRKIFSGRLREDDFARCGIAPQSRPENLSVADFACLSRCLSGTAVVTHNACG
ncbi:MAG: 16S rRNA (adenine(1518)-N(6)/adenine(1519)-N(6))-dimethyltransferase RsmA [Gammaproteobacteria bacterium]|nr:16S rRNA (adenine(1518)-N(6)/adenine(1519)-N(6))-dimethyltransferase RsmA [Gammaproteobacteria bacterium]